MSFTVQMFSTDMKDLFAKMSIDLDLYLCAVVAVRSATPFQNRNQMFW